MFSLRSNSIEARSSLRGAVIFNYLLGR